MNLFNFILIGIIFVSLVMIITIFGRSIRRVNSIGISSQKFTDGVNDKNFIFRFIGIVRRSIAKVFVLIAEWIVKKTKKVLHLVHFWLIKKKRGKKNEGLVNEIEAKKELIIEEEKNLEKVINEDLAQADEQKLKIEQRGKEISIVTEYEKVVIDGETDPVGNVSKVEKERKIANFFSRGKKERAEIPSEAEQERPIKEKSDKDSNFMLSFGSDETVQIPVETEEDDTQKGFLNKFKKPLALFQRFKKSDSIKKQEDQEKTDQFSDGVVKIEKPLQRPKDEYLIKEVVRTKRKEDKYDMDDELGIDRKILEKKILQKIMNNPRNVEQYRQLGELYIKMKNFGDARSAYKFILQVIPRDIDARRKIEKIKLLKRLN
ncbi:MAG: hypothetical protein U9M90_02950 [Patescibacteria group bacterium]|nr:hypothetical protein [Patescibacteria group bacterium]